MSYDYTVCKKSLRRALGKIKSQYRFASSELRCLPLGRKLGIKITCGDWYPPIWRRIKEMSAFGECTRKRITKEFGGASGSMDLMAGKVMFLRSNQGGRLDGNESVADSFRSDLVGFKSWSGRIIGAFTPSYVCQKKPPVGKRTRYPSSPSRLISDKKRITKEFGGASGSTDLMAGKVMFLRSNQGGRLDGNESVADSFRSDLVGFKSWSGRIIGAFTPSYVCQKNPPVGKRTRYPRSPCRLISDK
ncbi:hypothetical protein TNCV_1853071 [Trichonephila clavipes]|nr:hypothetical protein TNCV_1853071 [Trichonephila clavipes]